MASESASTAQPDPRPCIKTRRPPRRFPNSLPPIFPPPTLLKRPPSWLRPRRAPPSPTCPLHRKIRRGLLGKCLSATARFDSLDTPAAFSCRPSDCWSDLGDDAEEKDLDLQVTGDVVTRRPEMPYLRYPQKPPERINHTSLLLHRGRPHRVNTLTGHLITAPSFAGLHHGCC